MADNQSTVALNIGSQRVSMAHFTPAKGGKLVLQKYASTAVLADPANDAARLPQLQVAISQLANGLKLTDQSARYTISGQTAITRFVKLPPLEEDNIDQIVAFEAAQVVPFPLDQVIWDHQMLESSGIEKEVAIVAMKGDQLNEIDDVVKDAGLTTAEVDLSPIALYNAYRYSYPASDECVLLVDVGARTSNLIYIEGSRFFLRSVNVGGASLTAAIAKEYNMSFSDAETQKMQHGMVALGGGHTSQLDEASAALAMTIRNALSKLPAEVSRTNNLYRSQHGGSAPTRIILGGGGANLPYTKEFLEEKLNLPIDIFNPLQNVTLGKGVDTNTVASEAHLMGELVGLAVRPLGKAKVKIDLVPDAVEANRAEKKKRPMLLAGAVLFLGALGGYAFFKKSQADEGWRIAEESKQVVDTATGPANAIKKLEKSEENVDYQVNAIFEASEGRIQWLKIINSLGEHFAHDSVWITDMDPLVNFDSSKSNVVPISAVQDTIVKLPSGATGMTKLRTNVQNPRINAIRIRGFWRENPASSQVVNKLLDQLREKAGDVFEFERNLEGEKVPIEEEVIIHGITLPAGPDVEEYAFPFELRLPLKKNIPISK